MSGERMDDRKRALAVLDAIWPGEKRNADKAAAAIEAALRSVREEERARAAELVWAVKDRRAVVPGFVVDLCREIVNEIRGSERAGDGDRPDTLPPPSNRRNRMEAIDELVEPIDQPGAISWACSEEGGGPDVGIWVGLGGGEFLWCGEITRECYEEYAPDTHELGSDGGWWLIHYTKTEGIVLGKMLNAEAADHLTQLMARLLYKSAAE